jgi:hypothetical protein
MTTNEHKSTEELVSQSVQTPPVRDAGEFWTDFKAHASLRNQDVPVKTGPSAVSLWTSGLATAAAMLVIGFFVLTASSVSATQLRFIDVKSDHSAVMILTSDPEDGTVVWIEGMTADDPNGGST